MGSLFFSRHCLPALALFLTSFYSSLVVASVDTGATWLKSKQGTSGEFYSSPTQSNPQLSMLESLSALIYLNKSAGIDLLSANAFIAPSSINNSTEHLAKIILIKRGMGAAYSSELSSLVARQMAYSGFGHDISYETDPLSTALALDVFTQIY